MGKSALKMSNISKSFNGVQVLKDVNFDLKYGEVHALMGGNGAGKSTLMKILTGVYQADGGDIFINDQKVMIHDTNEARANGISMIFQEFSLIPTLTVAQNIFLGREPKTKSGFIDDKACIHQTRKLLEELKVDIDPNMPVEELSVGFWQMTEIAKALSQDTKVLIMDEPTASLTKAETEVLFQLITDLKQRGVSIIYISHRMEEIFKVCNRITVLRDGKKVVSESCSDVTLDDVIEHIVGGNLEYAFEWEDRGNNIGTETILQVKNLKAGHRVDDVSFDLHRGEILGIAGLMGSGRSETVRALFGIDRMDGGEVYINGERQEIKTPEDAIKAGLALVPEDRRVQGLVLGHSIKDNIVAPILDKVKGTIFINDQKGNSIVKESMHKLKIKAEGMFQTSNLLSGGNQQKVVLAKWLATSPNILFLDEPTAGVDIRSKTEIMSIIRDLANEGKGILVISSELTELLALCDRIIVMNDGRVTRQMYRENIESEEVLQHAVQDV